MSDVFPLRAIAVPLNEGLADRSVIHQPGSHDAFMVRKVLAMRRKSNVLLVPGGWIRAVCMRGQPESDKAAVAAIPANFFYEAIPRVAWLCRRAFSGGMACLRKRSNMERYSILWAKP